MKKGDIVINRFIGIPCEIVEVKTHTAIVKYENYLEGETIEYYKGNLIMTEKTKPTFEIDDIVEYKYRAGELFLVVENRANDWITIEDLMDSSQRHTVAAYNLTLVDSSSSYVPQPKVDPTKPMIAAVKAKEKSDGNADNSRTNSPS